MWASAPTRRSGAERVRRGGLYIRPDRTAVSEAPSPNTPAVGARMARPEPSAVFARPSVDAPGMAACGHAALRPQRSVKCFASGWQADALCAPLRPKEPSCPGASQDPPLRGNRKRIRRGGLYIRPCSRVGSTLAEHTRRRGAYGASGTECGFCKTFSRCTRHGGMWACRPTPAAIGEVLCIRVASGRAMRAPTAKRTIVPRRESGPGLGRALSPPLRGNRKRIRRGGLYIRPDRTAASDAPAPPALHTEPDLPAACISTSISAL